MTSTNLKSFICSNLSYVQ